MPERDRGHGRGGRPTGRLEPIAGIDALPGAEFIVPIAPTGDTAPNIPTTPRPRPRPGGLDRPRRPLDVPIPAPDPRPGPNPFPPLRPIPVPDIDIGVELPRFDRETLGVLTGRDLSRFLDDAPPVVKLPAGSPTRPIVVKDDALQRIVRTALSDPNKTVVWTGPGSELLVRFAETRVAARAGGVAFGFDVESGDGRTTASVMLSLATAKAPTGLVAGAGRVEAPAALDEWSESIIAASWTALLITAVRICAQAGVDRAGKPFVPVGIYAEDGHVGFVPRARHEWER